MEILKKNETDQDATLAGCSCTSQQGLYIPSRQLSWLVSGLLLLSFFIFMGGYFLGQKKVLEEFSAKLEQDSLSDKIYSSLYALYDTQGEESSDDQAESSDDSVDQTKKSESGESNSASIAQLNKTEQENKTPAATTNYYAQLAGFASAKPAYALAERLNQTNKIAIVKKHESKSSKGQIRYWYQVVTKPFDTKETLQQVVQQIKQKEHLKDIRIVTC